jgi:hypothetical protein
MKAEKFSAITTVKFLGFILFIMFMFSGNASADTTELFLEQAGGGGGKFSIDSGGTVERFLSGMSGFPGTIRLKAGFHVDSGIGEFEKLRLEIKKGNETVYNGSCYSIHAPSDKTPKCDLTINVSSAIADTQGNYVLKVNNNSGKRIKDFSIRKLGLDLLMPDFKSTFTPDCPDSISLGMTGLAVTLNKNSSVTREITGVGRKEGSINLSAKWHTATLIPNVFVKLKIELLRPDGSVAKSVSYYSIHAPSDKSPSFRLPMHYAMTQSDAGMPGRWKIKITNDSDEKIEGFDIEKGGDGNPFVKEFRSTYKVDCN